jgi:hypothetical protein
MVEPHRIDTETHPPVKQRAYRMSEEGHCIVDKECQKMLEKGVIKESNSPWSSPVVLVAKKNGEVRFCVDYRRLNSLTRKDSYPLPNVYDTLGALGVCKYFCTMDLHFRQELICTNLKLCRSDSAMRQLRSSALWKVYFVD